MQTQPSLQERRTPDVLGSFESWAQNHKLCTLTFWWGIRSQREYRLQGLTYNEALAVVMKLGYREPRWFKPWTWSNGVVTVG